jgi:hypothetical protein
MKKLILVLAGTVLLYVSCTTKGEPVEIPLPVSIDNNTLEQIAPPSSTVVPEVAGEPVFDPSSITQEIYNTTKKDVQQLIKELNGIILSRNYKAWVSYLGDDYFKEISSREFLRRTSESSFLKSKNMVLTSASDYFIHVVVPARTNSRVDDIEFISPKRVKAFTITASGQRLRLYELEDFGNGWKIIN